MEGSSDGDDSSAAAAARASSARASPPRRRRRHAASALRSRVAFACPASIGARVAATPSPRCAAVGNAATAANAAAAAAAAAAVATVASAAAAAEIPWLSHHLDRCCRRRYKPHSCQRCNV